jgi:hypothetical protein
MEGLSTVKPMGQDVGSMRENPYVGPRPFAESDAPVFFGRKGEVLNLYAQVASHRTVLLYAQSGAGKSSLLNAGLVPELEKGEYDVLRGGRLSEPARSLGPDDNIFVVNLTRPWNPSQASLGGAQVPSIAEVLQSIPRKFDEFDHPLTRVLVIDQFEELFTAHKDRWQQRTDFFLQLREAMTKEGDLRVLLAMREDYIANLDGYANLMLESCRTRVRLERLRREDALKAIELPLESCGMSFAPGVAEQLVHSLLLVERPPNESAELDSGSYIGEYVEPVQLQVVCFNCIRNLGPGVTVVTEDSLREHGNVDAALKAFYEDTLREVTSSTGVSATKLRNWFDCDLITRNDTRGLVLQREKDTGGLPNVVVDKLERIHIIRPEIRGSDTWYELSHDRLVRPIKESNRAAHKKDVFRKSRLIGTVLVAFALLGLIVGLHEKKQTAIANELLVSNQKELGKAKTDLQKNDDLLRVQLAENEKLIIELEQLKNMHKYLLDESNREESALEKGKNEQIQIERRTDILNKATETANAEEIAANARATDANARANAADIRAEKAETRAANSDARADELAAQARGADHTRSESAKPAQPETSKLTIWVTGELQPDRKKKQPTLPPEIYIDNHPYAMVSKGTYFTVDLTPTNHEICVSDPFSPCQLEHINAEKNKSYFIHIEASNDVYRPFQTRGPVPPNMPRIPASDVINKQALAEYLNH